MALTLILGNRKQAKHKTKKVISRFEAWFEKTKLSELPRKTTVKCRKAKIKN